MKHTKQFVVAALPFFHFISAAYAPLPIPFEVRYLSFVEENNYNEIKSVSIDVFLSENYTIANIFEKELSLKNCTSEVLVINPIKSQI